MRLSTPEPTKDFIHCRRLLADMCYSAACWLGVKLRNSAGSQFSVEAYLCQVQSVSVQIQKAWTHFVEALLLQALPQDLADPRQSGDWFVSHGLTDKVPMLLRCGGHPAGTNEPEPELSTAAAD